MINDTQREAEIMECLRANLKQAMKEKGLNSSRIMHMTGMSQSAAYDLFKEGTYIMPTIMTLDRMGEVLGISLSEIFRDVHQMDKPERERKLSELHMLLDSAPDEVLDRELAYLKFMRDYSSNE